MIRCHWLGQLSPVSHRSHCMLIVQQWPLPPSVKFESRFWARRTCCCFLGNLLNSWTIQMNRSFKRQTTSNQWVDRTSEPVTDEIITHARVLKHWDSRIATDRCKKTKEDEEGFYFACRFVSSILCYILWRARASLTFSVITLRSQRFTLAAPFRLVFCFSSISLHSLSQQTKKDYCTLHARSLSHNFAQFKRFMCVVVVHALAHSTFDVRPPSVEPISPQKNREKVPEEKPKHKLYCIIK